MKNENGVIIQSVTRALDILCFFQDEEELGISELARRMGLNKSTVYGLVNSLCAKNFLEQSPTTKRYRLGIKNFELGRFFQRRMDLWVEAKPLIKEYIEKYGETVHLASHDKGEVIYLNTVESPDVVVLYTQTGRRAPMNCSGVGKAMLAYLPEAYLDKYIFAEPLHTMTKYSIRKNEDLIQNLEQVRKLGYAVDQEEIEVGLCCVAAPIFNYTNQPIAAISLCGSATRMTPAHMENMSKDLMTCARLISRRMGYKMSN